METFFIPHSDYLAHHGIDDGTILLTQDESGEFLEHYQIKGAKHGVRRFQNYDGSLTAAGRERYGVGDPRPKKSAVKGLAEKVQKLHKENQKKTSKDKSTVEAEKAAKQKQKLMDHLREHPGDMYKHRKELSQQDVDDIMTKVKFDKTLKDIRKSEIDRGVKKISDIKGYVDTLNNVYNTSKTTWNNIAEVNNALIDMGINKNGKYIRKFGENDDSYLKRSKDKAKKEREEELERKLRNGEIEDIYNNRNKWSTEELMKAYKRSSTEDLVRNQVDKKKPKEAAETKPKEEKISDEVRSAIWGGSPKELMKLYNTANSKEKEAIEKAIADYQDVMELATKYKR